MRWRRGWPESLEARGFWWSLAITCSADCLDPCDQGVYVLAYPEVVRSEGVNETGRAA